MPFCVNEEKLDILVLVKEHLPKDMIYPTNENSNLSWLQYIRIHNTNLVGAVMIFDGSECRLQICRAIESQWFNSTFAACFSFSYEVKKPSCRGFSTMNPSLYNQNVKNHPSKIYIRY